MDGISVGAASLLVIVAVAGGLAVTYYNRLFALVRYCEQAAADIDVQMKYRHDLIPNLVATVQGYAGHERGVLESVIKSHAAATRAASASARQKAEAMLSLNINQLLSQAQTSCAPRSPMRRTRSPPPGASSTWPSRNTTPPWTNSPPI
jgi:LemA protein